MFPWPLIWIELPLNMACGAVFPSQEEKKGLIADATLFIAVRLLFSKPLSRLFPLFKVTLAIASGVLSDKLLRANKLFWLIEIERFLADCPTFISALIGEVEEVLSKFGVLGYKEMFKLLPDFSI